MIFNLKLEEFKATSENLAQNEEDSKKHEEFLKKWNVTFLKFFSNIPRFIYIFFFFNLKDV
jgi:hypothetical protein